MALRNVYLLIVLLMFFTGKAQTNHTGLANEWAAIDSLIVQKDLTRTALEKVNALYQKAKQRQLPDQMIKALIYRYTLEDRITTDRPDHIINSLTKEINTLTDETQKDILYSLLAKQYRQYYHTHRWNLYTRKNTQGLIKSDITTWSNDDFIKVITDNFLRSLKNKQALQQQKITTYDAIILKGNNRKARPTLFDLLAHEALDYFTSGETYATKPLQAFTINNANALGPMDTFLASRFPTNDSTEPSWLALDLFRQLISFHRADINKNALVEVDLERIEWVNRQVVFSGKETVYGQTLQTITEQYPSLPAAANAWYLLARTDANKAAGYTPFTDTVNRYGYVKARQLIKKALSFFSEPNAGTANMQNLLNEINQIQLHTETEKVNVPGKPLRALISYRNMDTLFARIIRINGNDPVYINRGGPGYWQKLSHLPAYSSFIQPLPAATDYQNHTAEIKIESLPPGQYVLLSSNGSGFTDTLNKLCAQYFYVSDISYIRNENDFFVLNRQSGMPIANVKVTILKQQYDGRQNKLTEEKAATITTDKNGYFRTITSKQTSNLRYVFTTATDSLNLNENEYTYYTNNDQQAEENDRATNGTGVNNRVFFFMDRSIYRPGQLVFFKGIAITRNPVTNLSKIINSKDSGWVYLKDVNSKRIDSLRYGLNSYGSFTGKFQLPGNGLTGNFSIEAINFPGSAVNFSVEEYKRPAFNISFEKVKGGYRLNDTIIITGTAKAYAGNAINGAKVAYNITRDTRYLIPWIWRRPAPQGNSREIAQGETVTDAQGKFTIKFKALADDIADSTGNPVFDFSIQTDITNLSGETRSATTKVNTGFSALLLQVKAPVIRETDSTGKIEIITTNLSNEKEPAMVQIKMYALQSPERLIRKRFWQRPDQFVMSEQEFISHFPTDEYRNETDFHTWATREMVISETIDTKDKEQIMIPAGSLQAGYYRIEAIATDKYGVRVKQQSFMQLFNPKNEQLPSPALLFNYTIHDKVEPGEAASFLTGTTAKNIFVISKTETPRQKNKQYAFDYRNNGLRTIQYTPDETDRGGVQISEAYVFDNRIYSSQYIIHVPWSNKQLQVNYASFRDKTEPGSTETWTVNVQGDKGEKTAAELLTGMYDASLDQFQPHSWPTPDIWPTNTMATVFTGQNNFSESNDAMENYLPQKYILPAFVTYDRLAANGYDFWNGKTGNPGNINIRGPYAYDQNKKLLTANSQSESMSQGKVTDMPANKFTPPSVAKDEETAPGPLPKPPDAIVPVIRKNFNETAFFFPQLYADSTGKYSFSFTIPEAITQWKWMSLAHTKDLAFGSNSATIITQKKLMVQPYAPRFMREGDNMEFSTGIANLTDKELTGQATLELFDATTHTSVDGWFQNLFPSQYFTVEPGQSVAVKFPLQIPFSFNKPLTWRIVAKAGDRSDGEENTLPVLPNRTLVTETLPLFMKGDTTQYFRFDKLLSNTSESLTHEGLTVEYTSNPVWYAVQALPYLMEYPYECSEQTFNRFFANTLAAYIVNKQPRIREVFEQWKADTSSLKSNLQKNEALKQVLLEETPWVLEAENETQQKKNISLLFDLAKLNAQSDVLIEKLRQMQLPNGSFSWFKGGNEDRYITNYILTGIGKLKRLGALTTDLALRIRTLLVNALQYMDGKIAGDYNGLIKNKATLTKQQLHTGHIDYLYMRSFFRDIALQTPEAYHYFYNQGKQFWTSQNSFYKAALGLIYYRNKEEKFATGTILPAILENASTDTHLGMYWKTAYTGSWYQSPVEHQSMMIAFMSEINRDGSHTPLTRQINDMKTWLLLNKQTNNWKTTIATAEACYALLLNGTDWLSGERKVFIRLGDHTTFSNNEKAEAGTGYFKKRMEGRLVNADMGNITVTVSSAQHAIIPPSPGWGSVHWQYFEDNDKITAATSPLSLHKKLFIGRNTDKGNILYLVKEGDELKTGDKIIVRIELRTDRDMDYLHLKDMRAAAMEPVNVLSGYKWQDGIGYYESTKDASTDFFIDHLTKGTYVFEYPLFITHTGIFSAGIATIQCMYAPEFSSHSEGIKIRVINPNP